MLVTPFNNDNERTPDLKVIKKRFLAINRERLKRAQNTLKWRQRNFLELLPLFFHTNHAMLPGYISKGTPAGIPLFVPSKKSLEAAKKLAKSFIYRRRALRSYDIHSIFIMGSVGTIAQSEKSDFDIWICYNPELNQSQLSELRAKCHAIERWADTIGLEVHFFPMDADKFSKGEVQELSSESSGSTQHHLLLEEFYRTSILISGRFPIWWLVPPGEEQNYDALVHKLLHKRFISGNEVIDFGGLSHVPAEEFFGAALWQVYKGIDSPYKSVLKILLMETYASSYPDSELLSLQFKKMVYDGQTDLDALDPYTILIKRLESYLRGRNEPERLELVRRCFYFKINIPLSLQSPGDDGWQRRRLREITALWGWDDEHIAELDKRDDWKIHRVLKERKILVDDLTHSYLFLSNFARNFSRNNVSLSRISQKDLNILGRKLYAAFERKAGKIEIVNCGVSTNVVEHKLTIQQTLTKQGEESWSLLNEKPDPQTNEMVLSSIKRGRSAAELLTWCHFNRLINPGTIVTLDVSNGILTVKEVKAIMNVLEQEFPSRKSFPTNTDDFEKAPVIMGACVFTNVGLDPLPLHTRRGTDIVSDKTDVLNYSGFSFNLALSFDLIIVTSWQEILTYRYSGLDGLLECICQFLRWNVNSVANGKKYNFSAYSFSSTHSISIARRIEELFNDVLAMFFRKSKPSVLRYIVEVQQSFYILYLEKDVFVYVKTATENELYAKLSEPQHGFSQIRADKYALNKTILPAVFPKNKRGKIQLFYEKSGEYANIFVLDEQGALFHQHLPFHDDHALVNQYMLFFDSVLNRQRFVMGGGAFPATVEDIVFCRVTKIIGKKCRFERKAINQDRLKHSYFHVQVIGNVVDQKTVFTIYCEDKEFSSFDYGNHLFREVAAHVLGSRASGAKYPIYITDLDLAPALLGERVASGVQIVEYLNYKKRIEEKLNDELRKL
ncbi:MAG: class I adenylate cyclase [Gammaproteobacteria bacterium]|nr:class I adenylate cyclase [Gammaproteobacteria bacterium]